MSTLMRENLYGDKHYFISQWVVFFSAAQTHRRNLTVK